MCEEEKKKRNKKTESELIWFHVPMICGELLV